MPSDCVLGQNHQRQAVIVMMRQMLIAEFGQPIQFLEDCMGADECPYGHKCFAALAKAKAQTTIDVVVPRTTRYLQLRLLIHIRYCQGKRSAVILDEAHEFMDRTTQVTRS
jgi:hypothetical protein